MDLGRTFDTARRAGVLDPAALLAAGGAAVWWGPGSAAAYAAAALRTPRRTAIIDDHGSLTYRQLELRATRVAGGLRHLGVERGQPVGLLSRNHRGFVEANLALAKLGARVVYLNPGLPRPQLIEVVDRERIGVVIADRDLADDAELADHPTLQRLVVSAPEDDRSWSFPDLPRWRPLVQLPRPTATDDPIVLTSGTTGAPKGTERRPSRATASAALGVLEAIPFRRGDVMVLPAPLFHAWGLSQLLIGATLGSTIVLRRSFDPEQVAADVEAHGATVLSVVPVMLHRLLAADPSFDMSSLQVVASSGSALPSRLAERWMDRFGPTLYNLYGSTEVGQVSIATPDDLLVDPGTAGRPVRGVDVEIVDDDGSTVPRGDVGRIVVRSGMHFDGYTDGGTKEMVDAHMSIGDLGRIDDAGRLQVLGRSDDMIISGGENLYPANIERALLQHPSVTEAVVVGVADDDLGQKVRAIIVAPEAGPTRSLVADVKASITDALAPHERPRDYVVVDALPRNASGKVLRRQLTGSRRSIPNRTPSRKKATT